MASARKTHSPKRPTPSEPHRYGAFLGDLLDGSIVATALHEQRNGQGRLIRLEYDDPNGNGGGGGNRGARVLSPESADPQSEPTLVSFRAPRAKAEPKPVAKARRRK